MRALKVAMAIVFATGLIWSAVVMLELVPLDGSEVTLAATSRPVE
jgi:hypothetical protein